MYRPLLQWSKGRVAERVAEEEGSEEGQKKDFGGNEISIEGAGALDQNFARKIFSFRQLPFTRRARDMRVLGGTRDGRGAEGIEGAPMPHGRCKEGNVYRLSPRGRYPPRYKAVQTIPA